MTERDYVALAADYQATIASQPERAIEARRLAEAYIEYEDVDELAAHLKAVLHLWQIKGFRLR